MLKLSLYDGHFSGKTVRDYIPRLVINKICPDVGYIIKHVCLFKIGVLFRYEENPGLLFGQPSSTSNAIASSFLFVFLRQSFSM